MFLFGRLKKFSPQAKRGKHCGQLAMHHSLCEIEQKRRDQDEAVHDIRKRLKKILALLRLVRPASKRALVATAESVVKVVRSTVERCRQQAVGPVNRYLTPGRKHFLKLQRIFDRGSRRRIVENAPNLVAVCGQRLQRQGELAQKLAPVG